MKFKLIFFLMLHIFPLFMSLSFSLFVYLLFRFYGSGYAKYVVQVWRLTSQHIWYISYSLIHSTIFPNTCNCRIASWCLFCMFGNHCSPVWILPSSTMFVFFCNHWWGLRGQVDLLGQFIYAAYILPLFP